MILVDTSIWVDHARQPNASLADLLSHDRILSHPFVIGELALGGFKPDTLRLLGELPSATVATDEEVLGLIERKGFAGRGIGYVDAHLLASAQLSDFARVWTWDKSLSALAADLGLLTGPERRLS